MTTPFTAYLDEVMPELPGCPVNIAVHALRNAAIKLCERSLVWQVDLTPVATSPGVSTYTPAAPTDTRVARVTHVRWNDIPMSRAQVTLLNRIYGNNWRTWVDQAPQAFTQVRYDQLILVPAPTLVKNLAVTVALAPTRAATGADDMLYEKYAPLIASGAKAYLMAQKKKPYSDPTQALEYRRQFGLGVGEVQRDVNRSLGDSGVVAQFRRG